MSMHTSKSQLFQEKVDPDTIKIATYEPRQVDFIWRVLAVAIELRNKVLEVGGKFGAHTRGIPTTDEQKETIREKLKLPNSVLGRAVIDELCALKADNQIGRRVVLGKERSGYAQIERLLNAALKLEKAPRSFLNHEFYGVACYLMSERRGERSGNVFTPEGAFASTTSDPVDGRTALLRAGAALRFHLARRQMLTTIGALLKPNRFSFEKLNASPLHGSLVKYGIERLLQAAFPQKKAALALREFSITREGVKWYGVKGRHRAALESHRLLIQKEKFGALLQPIEERRNHSDPELIKRQLSRFREVNWREVFEKNHLKGMLACCSATPTARDALWLGMKHGGVVDLFGAQEYQLLPSDIRVGGQWSGAEGLHTLDFVTARVVEVSFRRMRERYFTHQQEWGSPSMSQLTSEESAPYNPMHFSVMMQDPRVKVLKNGVDLSKMYMHFAESALDGTGLSPTQALMRVYPHLFGLLPNRVHPWEVRKLGKWKSPEAQHFYRCSVAYALMGPPLFSTTKLFSWYRPKAIGTFSINPATRELVAHFTIEDFKKWYSVATNEASGTCLSDCVLAQALMSSAGATAAIKEFAPLTHAIKIFFAGERASELGTITLKRRGWLLELATRRMVGKLGAPEGEQPDAMSITIGKLTEDELSELWHSCPEVRPTLEPISFDRSAANDARRQVDDMKVWMPESERKRKKKGKNCRIIQESGTEPGRYVVSSESSGTVT
jgi:hypothetical protein